MDTIRAHYIIVGGGTAACVLAARLSEDPRTSVLLLEAGKHYRGLSVRMPGAVGSLYARGQYHWPYRSAPEPHAEGRTLPYKMGRVLGGSSAINGLVWVRGNFRDFDDWETAGNLGWGSRTMTSLYRRIESYQDRTDSDMGHDGPIPVSRARAADQLLSEAFLKSALRAGYAFNSNYNGREQEGFCELQRNTRNGIRGDVYEGYLYPVQHRRNLTVLPESIVEHINLQGLTASGVFARRKHRALHATAEREVILSAGALASPQLLELSGIGDSAPLTNVGVQVRHELPGVGANLHTHPTIKLSFSSTKPVSLYSVTRPIGRIRAGVQWLWGKRGPAASTHFDVGAFLRSDLNLDRPDLQLTFFPLALTDATSSISGHGFQIYVELIGVKSRGWTHIKAGDVMKEPNFRMNLLHDDRDVIALTRAVQLVRELVAQAPLSDFRGAELEPGSDIVSPEAIAAWLRRSVSMSHHLVGTCKMGPRADPMSVVDSDLRVHGISGLRVVDASIMPTVTSGNTHAPVIAIAERASELIRQTHRLDEGVPTADVRGA